MASMVRQASEQTRKDCILMLSHFARGLIALMGPRKHESVEFGTGILTFATQDPTLERCVDFEQSSIVMFDDILDKGRGIYRHL
jgi:hypothetical protein